MKPCEKFKPGMQVMYTPGHLKPGDDGCEYGFVTSINVNTNTVFARYWRSDSTYDNPVLRTTACSEGCDPENLTEHWFTHYSNVAEAWKKYTGLYLPDLLKTFDIENNGQV